MKLIKKKEKKNATIKECALELRWTNIYERAENDVEKEETNKSV